MKVRSVLIIAVIFLLIFLSGLHLILKARTGKGLISTLFEPHTSGPSIDYNTFCSGKPVIPGLNFSKDPNLAKLAEYQEICNSFASDTLMLFSDMPFDQAKAVEMANTMAIKLQEFSKYGIKPLVIVEPVTDQGMISFRDFATGKYDNFLDTYFKALKEQHLNDSQLGTWVPFPEANLPIWNNDGTTPADFSIVVNKYLGIMKQYFPASQASVLLDSKTYNTSVDRDWSKGEYKSLVPYIEGLNHDYIDSFGLQGFPWLPDPGNVTSPPIIDPQEYLSYNLADEAARTLGVKKIWFNTGTFRSSFTNTTTPNTMAAEQRKKILAATIAEAQKLQNHGYSLFINLFAENKSQTQEATDWSYFNTPADQVSDKDVLKYFLGEAEKAQIPVSLFDTKPDQ